MAFALGVAGERPLVIERPLVGRVELLVNSLGAAKDLGNRLSGSGEENAGGVHHGRQGVVGMKFGINRVKRNGPGERGAQTVTTAGDGDGGALENRRRLEAGLPIAGQPVVAGYSQIRRNNALAEQAVGKVSGNVRLTFAAIEVATGRLNGQCERSPELSQPLTFQAGKPLPQAA